MLCADHLVNNYACSICYGPLIEDIAGNAVCAAYRGEHQGYVSQWWVNHYREMSDLIYAEAAYYYSQTKYAQALGLKPALTGQALQNQLIQNRRSLGRDDSGL